MSHTIAERLAQFSHGLSYDDIPPEVIEKTKRLILDTIGVCIGSTRIDFGRAALQLAARWGGAPEATLIGRRMKVPVQSAAFCNGVLGHGQDYDDTHTESVVHPSAALVPVALAMAERAGSSGRETVAALVGGMEATIRIAMPALNRFHLRGFHTTSIAATFGAALIAARLGRMGFERTVESVGVSGSFTSGLLECIPASAGAKRLHGGWAALCGIVAAQLAEGGYTGPATVFEGKLGVYNSFLRGEPLDLSVIFNGLGREWEILNVRPKLYPCCHFLQSFLDAAAGLRREHGLRAEDIATISCRVAPDAVNIVCEPWEKKMNPITGYDARFSLPFAVALMLAKGKAGVAEFSEQSFTELLIRQLMSKVSYQVEPKYQVKDMPGWIEVTLKNGARNACEIPEVRGNARNPVALEELLDKFYANTEFRGRSASSRIADDILGLERLGDIHGFMGRLCEPEVAATVA